MTSATHGRIGQPLLLAVALRMTCLLFVIGLAPLYRMVNILCILGDQRQCLHDRIAGTQVVMAEGRGRVDLW